MAIPGRHLAIPVALAAFLAVSAIQAGDFFSSIRDLPLMPGLEEREEAAIVFDHEGGRVTTALASGPVEPAAIRRFYRLTLPPLGWVPECAEPRCPPPDRYRREGEALELELAVERGETEARFLFTRNLSQPLTK